jgi:succinate dehydrogenase/fumarate reductase flavoprotein subunit
MGPFGAIIFEKGEGVGGVVGRQGSLSGAFVFASVHIIANGGVGMILGNDFYSGFGI